MSIGFDPIISSILFSAGLIPHTFKPVKQLELPENTQPDVPFVSVIVALYREKREDIEMTLESLLRQTHPRNRFEVLLAVEAHDRDIRPLAEEGRQNPLAAGID